MLFFHNDRFLLLILSIIFKKFLWVNLHRPINILVLLYKKDKIPSRNISPIDENITVSSSFSEQLWILWNSSSSWRKYTYPLLFPCVFSPCASASTQSLSWLNSSSFYYMALYDNRLASWSTFSWLSCSWKVTTRNENRFFGFLFFFPVSSDFCSYYSCFLIFFSFSSFSSSLLVSRFLLMSVKTLRLVSYF